MQHHSSCARHEQEQRIGTISERITLPTTQPLNLPDDLPCRLPLSHTVVHYTSVKWPSKLNLIIVIEQIVLNVTFTDVSTLPASELRAASSS